MNLVFMIPSVQKDGIGMRSVQKEHGDWSYMGGIEKYGGAFVLTLTRRTEPAFRCYVHRLG